MMNWTMGIHPIEITNALKHIVDGIAEMRLEETQEGKVTRFIRIFMLRGIKYNTVWSAIKN